MGNVIGSIIAIAIPMVAVGIIYLSTDSLYPGKGRQWRERVRRLRGLLILVIPAFFSVILYKYYDFNPVTVFVRTLAIQWGVFFLICLKA